MSKEKVFIVLSHKNSLKKGSKTEWELTETIEFVNQLRKKHTSMSSAIGDYLNKKMITGARIGMGEYDTFDKYIRSKYEEQLLKLDAVYKSTNKSPRQITDSFGNTRPVTVFDV